jgi:hypothetical protein
MVAVMNAHAQTLVKVNVQVDKGIAPLVEALNACPGVFTTSSCEGRKDENAYVAFDVGGNDDKLAAFIRSLSTVLGQDNRACDLPFTLSLEWYAGGKTPAGYLRVPRQHIHALADAVRSAAANVVSGRHDRSSTCPGGTGCRAPARSTERQNRRRPAKPDGARASCPS